jgi:anti-sigma B factor antagonist
MYPEQTEETCSMELDIKSDRDNDVCAVTLEGEIDVYTAPRLKEELVSVVESGCPNVIVDMEKVGFIDSSGLGVLVSALRRARERDGVVRIVCTRENILKIFRITGLDKVFPIYGDMADARRF